MKDWNNIGIQDFLSQNADMVFVSLSSTQAVLEGIYHLHAHHPSKGNADCDYKLRIEIPNSFPRKIPIVRETSYKIPRDRRHHVNMDSDSLCLGSRISILQKMHENPTISGFVEKCIVPFLYSVTFNSFVFGELEHGCDGILEEYQDIFSVFTDMQVLNILLCISKKKRIANKYPCPCGCGYRLGKCKLHDIINRVRYLAPRNSFKVEYNNILKEKKIDHLLLQSNMKSISASSVYHQRFG
jgi:hypothetical protein